MTEHMNKENIIRPLKGNNRLPEVSAMQINSYPRNVCVYQVPSYTVPLKFEVADPSGNTSWASLAKAEDSHSSG